MNYHEVSIVIVSDNAKAFRCGTSNQYSSYVFFVIGHVEELLTTTFGNKSSMFKIEWDNETGGILLSSRVTKDTLGVSPRPVWFEELDLLGLDKLGWEYPRCETPLMWAVNKPYFYRGRLMYDADIHLPVIKFKNAKDSVKIVGRGGTDFDPIIKFFEKNRQYDGLIMFTDGYADMPIIPNGRKVLWALTNRLSYDRFALNPKICLPE